MAGFAVINRDWNYPIEEVRTSLESTQTPLSYPAEWLLDIFNGGRTDSGIRVSELTALQTSTFLACVDLISGVIASLDMHIYERTFSPNGRPKHRIAFDHSLYDMISVEPNVEMSKQTFIKAFLCHCLAWGNGFQEVQRDIDNNPVALWPRNPAKTRPRRLTNFLHLDPVPWRPFPVNLAAGTMAFETTDGMDVTDNSEIDARSRDCRIIPAEDMIAVPGLALDGRVGQSVVWLARQTIGLALAMEKFGAKYFSNFAKPGGVLESPAVTRKEDRDAARQSWIESQGGENAHRIAVLPPGYKFTPIANNPEQSQTVETRAFNRNEICAIMHVPPHMVGDVDRVGKANTEHLAQEFIQYTLAPWMSAIKIEYKRKLFRHKGVGRVPRNNFYVDFDTSDMLRPDAASREKFYASGSQWRYLCPNDIRGFEKLNPIEEPWAEEFMMPVNMTMATTPINPNEQDGAGNGDKSIKPAKSVPEPPANEIFARLFSDGFERILLRRSRDYHAFKAVFEPLLYSVRESVRLEAAAELDCDWRPTADSDRFITDYIWEMRNRCAAWEEVEEIKVAEEFDRFLRILRVSVFREVAEFKAKVPALR